ncbi:STM3941 family protein [Nocardioides taihuensis]|uniref:STM3941 family protein n=1 Tax=Nocardioides taihuensis TaxID=1835606 RepID=A0ABW0BP22_9ACTN
MDETEVMARFRAWDDQLLQHDRVEIGFKRVRLALLTGVCLVFAAIGAALALSSTGFDLVMAWACLLLFGAGAVALGRQALRGGAGAVITSREVLSPTQGWSVPWSAVRGAFVFSSRGTHLVTIVVDPTWFADWTRGHGAVKAGLARVNKGFLGVESMSLPGQLDVDTDLLAAWIDSRGTDFRKKVGDGPTAG